MKLKIKNSILSSILLLFVDILVTCSLITSYKHKNENSINSILQLTESKITQTFDHLFFSIELTEALVKADYESFSKEELDILLSPVVAQSAIRNISFLPNGIVKHVYPYEGNEKAIGDNIFEMPGRKEEAEIAIKKRSTILSGPYELTQGGLGLIARKAIFLTNEKGEEEFWGMTAIVMDADKILDSLNLQAIESWGYKYELSTNVNGQGKKIIAASDRFRRGHKSYSEISLPNGSWEICISKKVDILQLISVLVVFFSGILIIIIRYRYVRKSEKEIEAIRNEVYLDNLTGLYNRKKLELFASQQSDSSVPYTVFFIDLNDFKIINDTYGHDIGDKLLISFSNRIRKIIRTDDLAIRIGGDEFIIILPNLSNKEFIKKFSTRLESLQEKKLVFDKKEISLNISYGYATFPTEGQCLEEILELADTRMYAQKKQSKS